MRAFGLVFLFLVCGLCISLAYSGLSQTPTESYFEAELELNSIEEIELHKARDLLLKDKPGEAIRIIKHYQSEIEKKSFLGKQWLALFIQANEMQNHISQLHLLFEFSPEVFANHERASIKIATNFIDRDELPKYDEIRELWVDREQHQGEWVLLDVDRLLIEENKIQAIELLRKNSFSGDLEVGRLVRLALLTQDHQLEKSWQYLEKAYSIDPQNVKLRLYRAEFLEMAGKNDLALREYQSLVTEDPENLNYQDKLADFYIKRGEFDLALGIWEKYLTPDAPIEIWLKTFFWNKVVLPIDFDWKSAELPKGKLQPLLEYLIQLDHNDYWSHDSFVRLSSSRDYLINRQETYWLRLISAIQNQDYKVVWNLLQYNTFSASSWNPNLEFALKQILKYRRKKGSNVINQSKLLVEEQPLFALSGNKPFFFSQLDQYVGQKDRSIPSDLEALLKSPEVFAAALVSAGWTEAALDLHVMDRLPDQLPDWIVVGITQAIRENRDNEDALAFARKQKSNSSLDLLMGELFVEEGDFEAGLDKLNYLTQLGSDIGFRASWLVSLIHMENGDYERAKSVIKSETNLFKDVLGKEALARIALKEGNPQKADQIYHSIENRSSEAKSYLARIAFTNGEWSRARELTEQLLREHPTNRTLENNLKKIIEHEAREISQKARL